EPEELVEVARGVAGAGLRIPLPQRHIAGGERERDPRCERGRQGLCGALTAVTPCAHCRAIVAAGDGAVSLMVGVRRGAGGGGARSRERQRRRREAGPTAVAKCGERELGATTLPSSWYDGPMRVLSGAACLATMSAIAG